MSIDATAIPPISPALDGLLRAVEPEARDQAWADFVAAHSRVLLHTCRTLARDGDTAMDAYTYVLEALRNENCRRLRAYIPDPNTRFTTWLVVVTRRLFRDFERHKYGRPRSENDAHRAQAASRRRIEDLVGEAIDVDTIGSSKMRADAAVRRQELASALARSLATLEPADRLLLALRFQDERPIKEIATVLGVPTVFHVYRRLNSVLETLRGALNELGVVEAEP